MHVASQIVVRVIMSVVMCLCVKSLTSAQTPERPPHAAGMVWIAGGEFTMGSTWELARSDEKPVHRVRLDGFWMDATEVTNAQFRQFAEATSYVTTAEQAPNIEELMAQLPPSSKPPPAEMLVPGSLVFTPPSQGEMGGWEWRPGASWRKPHGPGSSLDGKDDHPAVHVSWFDATAYCQWVSKRLPTEAEWEYAARGGLSDKPYVWGEENLKADAPRANTWQGTFPFQNTGADGYISTSPVRSFPSNAYGLYDMAGNAWEWTQDWYRADTYAQQAGLGVADNPQGPNSSYDPQEPTVPKRVHRGGSYLCHESYCSGYRPSARMKASPDTSLSHTGFRCAMTADRAAKTTANLTVGRGIPERPRGPRKLSPGRYANESRLPARLAYFGPQIGWLETLVLHRSDLVTPCEGPCIIEEYDATCVVPPRAKAVLDDFGNILIDLL